MGKILLPNGVPLYLLTECISLLKPRYTIIQNAIILNKHRALFKHYFITSPLHYFFLFSIVLYLFVTILFMERDIHSIFSLKCLTHPTTTIILTNSDYNLSLEKHFY